MAQFGRALGLGPRGPEFESLYLDFVQKVGYLVAQILLNGVRGAHHLQALSNQQKTTGGGEEFESFLIVLWICLPR